MYQNSPFTLINSLNADAAFPFAPNVNTLLDMLELFNVHELSSGISIVDSLYKNNVGGVVSVSIVDVWIDVA